MSDKKQDSETKSEKISKKTQETEEKKFDSLMNLFNQHYKEDFKRLAE